MRYVAISGCSGGGKSSLLQALARRGFTVAEEPGRRIVAEQQAAGRQDVLPWIDPIAFARRAVDIALADREAARHAAGWVFFDRGLVDAATALEHATGVPQLERLCRDHRYHRTVFLTPPWPEIFVTDDARRHDMAAALAEYDRLLVAYAALGYEIEILPKASVAERVEFVLGRLGA